MIAMKIAVVSVVLAVLILVETVEAPQETGCVILILTSNATGTLYACDPSDLRLSRR
jgi:hypothetical protein